MEEKIAVGFHTCIDYEILWDNKMITEQVRKYEIQSSELEKKICIKTERDLLIACLAYMQDGTGVELMPENEEICTAFASHFNYKVTLGGTAARAAAALSKIGYKPMLMGSTRSRYAAELMPEDIVCFSNMNSDKVYPHIILQYPAGEEICTDKICIRIPRNNRIMFSKDAESERMEIVPELGDKITDARVVLLSSFNMIPDTVHLRRCLDNTRKILGRLDKKTWVVMEDACYKNNQVRQYVHSYLENELDIISMNEDELQDYTGRTVNMQDAKAVYHAASEVKEKSRADTIIVHSAEYALAFGRNADQMRPVLDGGILLASARYLRGDSFGIKEYEEIKKLPFKNQVFCDEIERIGQGLAVCRPCRNLDSAERPSTVGLGDHFAAGMLPVLAHLEN